MIDRMGTQIVQYMPRVRLDQSILHAVMKYEAPQLVEVGREPAVRQARPAHLYLFFRKRRHLDVPTERTGQDSLGLDLLPRRIGPEFDAQNIRRVIGVVGALPPPINDHCRVSASHPENRPGVQTTGVVRLSHDATAPVRRAFLVEHERSFVNVPSRQPHVRHVV